MPITFQKARASKTDSQTLKEGIPAKILLNVTPGKDFDPYGIFDAANSRFQPVEAGYYHVDAQLSWAVAPGNASKLSIYKNDAEHTTYACYATNAPVFTLSDVIFLNGTTDYLEMWAYHQFGKDLAAGGSPLTDTFFSIIGPF